MTVRQLADAIDGLTKVMEFTRTELFVNEDGVDALRAMYVLGRLVEASARVLDANETTSRDAEKTCS